MTVDRRTFLTTAAGIALANAVRAAPQPQPPSAKPSTSPFPSGFAWGAATAAYQIEGAATEDGKGPSVWDVFCKKKDAIFEGHTGDVACDHYHRYRDDFALLKQLGVTSYRFSISWPRVLPKGIGTPNQAGLDFYSRLLDELGKHGITPMCTMFHWDFPQALYEKRGWLNRDSAEWFAEYAALLADKFSDRIKVWATQNEPQCFIGLGLLEGRHAPGDKLKFGQFLTAAHNQMRSHAKAVQVLRARAKDAKVGYVVVANPTQPATETPDDIEAARAAMFAVPARTQWNNAWWIDPVLLGKYPEDGIATFGRDMPKFKASDLDEMKQPLDFLGLNIYSADTVRRGADGKPEHVPSPPGFPHSGVDWQPITPACLYWGPRYFYERYKVPVAITENGIAVRDQVFLDGKVHDPQRIDYMHRALLELARACGEGIPVTGYWAWSLMDNFEWADGYKQRFGLIYVDYQNQKRIAKDSFAWYRDVIASNGRNLFEPSAVPATQVTPL